MKTILSRLEHLEKNFPRDGGVALLELLPSGEWELMMDGNRSVHQTLEEGKLAHQEFLRKHRTAEGTEVLIIADL